MAKLRQTSGNFKEISNKCRHHTKRNVTLPNKQQMGATIAN